MMKPFMLRKKSFIRAVMVEVMILEVDVLERPAGDPEETARKIQELSGVNSVQKGGSR